MICHSRESGNPESMNRRDFFVYILANQKNGAIYVDVTNNLIRRIYEHKNNIIDGFTKKYNIHNLVYYESYDDIRNAISREKQIKKWNRKWKIRLIEENNYSWKDLYKELNPIN